jgi:hypothetical protein
MCSVYSTSGDGETSDGAWWLDFLFHFLGFLALFQKKRGGWVVGEI